MAFRSILFPDGAAADDEDRRPEPAFFRDLALGRVVAAVTRGKEQYDLRPFFHRPLRRREDIAFRHEVMRDVEDAGVGTALEAFAREMEAVRKLLEKSGEVDVVHQRAYFVLAAANRYCRCVGGLREGLAGAGVRSRGMRSFLRYLEEYAASARFRRLSGFYARLEDRLASIRYTVLIDGLFVRLGKYDGEEDYGRRVEAAFSRFDCGDVDPYPFEIPEYGRMNSVEERIIGKVAELWPDLFADLGVCLERGERFLDPAVRLFDREVQFYVAYASLMKRLRAAGLPFCYPDIRGPEEGVFATRAYDLALGEKLVAERRRPVPNDFRLDGAERIIVVTGPNQGGKTTFARMFGQMHHLAALGCPVPGTSARLALCDAIFTHFEREEAVADLRGRLQDDLYRIHGILGKATRDSLVVLNEIFSSTMLSDAVALSREIASRLLRGGMICVWVTFVDELVRLDGRMVSMTGSVDPGNPAERTYRIERRPPEGLAYARSIVEKYRLSYASILERVGR